MNSRILCLQLWRLLRTFWTGASLIVVKVDPERVRKYSCSFGNKWYAALFFHWLQLQCVQHQVSVRIIQFPPNSWWSSGLCSAPNSLACASKNVDVRTWKKEWPKIIIITVFYIVCSFRFIMPSRATPDAWKLAALKTYVCFFHKMFHKIIPNYCP